MEVKKVLSILETPLFSVKMPPHLMLNLMGKAIRPSILAKYEQSESIFRNKQFYKNANLDGVWVSAMEAKNWPVIHALLENYPEGLDIHDAIALNNYVVVNAMARFTMESILDHAIIVGDITMVAMLFEHPQYSEKWAHTGVVQYAAGRGHVKVLKYLIEEFGMRCDNSVMDAAAANGHLNTVKLLFKTGHGCTSEAYRAAAAGAVIGVVPSCWHCFCHRVRSPTDLGRGRRSRQRGPGRCLEARPWQRVGGGSCAAAAAGPGVALVARPQSRSSFLPLKRSSSSQALCRASCDPCADADEGNVVVVVVVELAIGWQVVFKRRCGGGA